MWLFRPNQFNQIKIMKNYNEFDGVVYDLTHNDIEYRFIKASEKQIDVEYFWPERNIWVLAKDREAIEVLSIALIQNIKI